MYQRRLPRLSRRRCSSFPVFSLCRGAAPLRRHPSVRRPLHEAALRRCSLPQWRGQSHLRLAASRRPTILPKPVRERFHLREGSELTLEEHPDGLVLKPVINAPPWCRNRESGFILAKLPRGYDWDTLVEASRDARIKTPLEYEGMP